MLKEGLDVYLPLVDDAINAVVTRPDGRFMEVQIKALSRDVGFGYAGLFAGLTHEHRKNYSFVFYLERLYPLWIMSSKEFIDESRQNKEGKNAGKRTIFFNGKNTKEQKEHVKPQYQKYVAPNFRCILEDDLDE